MAILKEKPDGDRGLVQAALYRYQIPVQRVQIVGF